MEDNELPVFDVMDLHEDNIADLRSWVDSGDLVGLVDESMGGIIGYIHHAHAERIQELLNSVQSPA